MGDLLETIYRNGPDLMAEVRALVAAGADVNRVTEYSESPLRVASNNGRFDVVQLLLQSGADASQLKWTSLMLSIAFGDLAQMKAALRQDWLEERDWWSRTPFLLAILTGDTAKCDALLAAGCDPAARGRCAKTPLQYAVQNNDLAMQRWLLEHGFAIDATDEFGTTALISAVELDRIESVRFLLEQGAELRHENNIPSRAIEYANTPDIAEVLLEYGEDIDAMARETYSLWLGMEHGKNPKVSPQEYAAAKNRVFGRQNPEETNRAFWLEMIRSGANAYQARCHFDDKESAQPVWCFSRFGRSTVRLPDCRIVAVAGEHEDHYDPDFCIYNDVTVFEPGGSVQILSYSEEDFPPTDFHTATLFGNFIYLIGSLGYPELRQPGKTPVYRLDIRSYRIEKVETKGYMPGWISGHRAWLNGDSILVEGGRCIVDEQGEQQLVPNTARWRLDLNSRIWSLDATNPPVTTG